MSNQTYFIATTPVEGKDGKTRFPRVGVAFPTKEGSKAYMNIKLDAFPVNGEIVLFAPTAKEVKDEDQS